MLPGPLLESLIPNLSSLASVYQKPPHTFLGKGRSSALQAAAIEEAKENARENPIAAAAVSAAVAGTSAPQATTHAENLLDIDFDGAAPASMQNAPMAGASGLEGLAGTPIGGTPARVASPAFGGGGGGGMDDLMGMFGDNGPSAAPQASLGNGGGMNDLMNGFDGMSMDGAGQGQSGSGGEKQTKEDLLGLFKIGAWAA